MSVQMVQLSELFAHIDFLLDNVPKLTDQLARQLNAIFIPVIVFGSVFLLIAVLAFLVCVVFYAKSSKAVGRLLRDEGNKSILTGSFHEKHDLFKDEKEPGSYCRVPSIDELPTSPYNIYHGATTAAIHSSVTPFNPPTITYSFTEAQKTYSELKLENLKLKNKRLQKMLKDSNSSTSSEDELEERGSTSALLRTTQMFTIASCPNMRTKAADSFRASFETIVEANPGMSREQSFYSTMEPPLHRLQRPLNRCQRRSDDPKAKTNDLDDKK